MRAIGATAYGEALADICYLCKSMFGLLVELMYLGATWGICNPRFRKAIPMAWDYTESTLLVVLEIG